MWELQATPHVIVYIEPNNRAFHVVDLLIANIGASPAYNLEFTFPGRSIEFKVYQGHQDQLFILENGIKFLAPGQTLRYPMGRIGVIDDSDLQVNIEYFRTAKKYAKNKHEDSFLLRFKEFNGNLVHQEISDIAIKTVAASLKNIDQNGVKIRSLPKNRTLGSDESLI